jgi:hypothetical protein
MREQVLQLEQLRKVLADAVAHTNAQLASQSDSPRQALYGCFVYSMRELSFSVPCCVESRVVRGQRQPVLQLRAPAWWRRLGRKVECRELEICVSPAHVTLQLHPAPSSRMPKRGLRCVFTLSPEDCAALAIDRGDKPTETVTFSRDSQPSMD